MEKLIRNWWIVFCLFPAQVLAASSGGNGLEWETPLQRVANSIKGPVAFGVSLLAIVACGCALAFGGEIGEFVRRIIMLVLVISVIVFAASILQNLFGVGALI
jgi:type IV secretion system protein TrbC